MSDTIYFKEIEVKMLWNLLVQWQVDPACETVSLEVPLGGRDDALDILKSWGLLGYPLHKIPSRVARERAIVKLQDMIPTRSTRPPMPSWLARIWGRPRGE